MLTDAGVRTLVDVRRFPSSRRHPQFDQQALAAAVESKGIRYRHAVELGGRRSREPGEERFRCIEVAAFRSYDLRLAAIVGPSLFTLGAAAGHIREMVEHGNFAPGNAGVIFYMDILIPAFGLGLLYATRRRSAPSGAA